MPRFTLSVCTARILPSMNRKLCESGEGSVVAHGSGPVVSEHQGRQCDERVDLPTALWDPRRTMPGKNLYAHMSLTHLRPLADQSIFPASAGMAENG